MLVCVHLSLHKSPRMNVLYERLTCGQMRADKLCKE